MNDLIIRTNAITGQYLERFGRVRIGIYLLTMSPKRPFSSYCNSLMAALRRKDLMPCYAWFSTMNPESKYLIVWCNGYFKDDLSDVTYFVDRLLRLHSFGSFCPVDYLIGDATAISLIKARVNNLIACCYSSPHLFHQRSFGTSVIV